VTDYEKMLGSQSTGLVWGHSTYNNGARALHGDFPIFILVMMKLRTREAREFQAHNFHQGVVMMGGNDEVALAMSRHWREQREEQPWIDSNITFKKDFPKNYAQLFYEAYTKQKTEFFSL
jgi:hypothetical protein